MKEEQLYYSRLIQQFDDLIYRVMHDLQVDDRHLFYDDLTQELRLRLIDIAKQFEGNPFKGEDRYRFTAYARKGLRWYLLDRLRSYQCRQAISQEDLDRKEATLLASSTYSPDQASQANLIAFFEEVKRRLNPEDTLLFWLLFDDSYTMSEIAELLGISRPTLYARKRNLQATLEDLKDLLIN
ncbi:hypothetical protein CL176_09555 [Suicoccus acidiformans]|uniref:RNA polymerase sigma-70 region 2 domain-containing protein n=1 Tax=Suicoccus acidiformans TaxID=2036206 RepID=A0A347WMB7_9LACT|nr:sigma-70 family RNA polymerase sigma factor [Suicoccus acidiformans]AXY26224.1 hypothetical protein CL176_09555 [Suicoccus acidiformans]